mgnify:CR=1 FL=1
MRKTGRHWAYLVYHVTKKGNNQYPHDSIDIASVRLFPTKAAAVAHVRLNYDNIYWRKVITRVSVTGGAC